MRFFFFEKTFSDQSSFLLISSHEKQTTDEQEASLPVIVVVGLVVRRVRIEDVVEDGPGALEQLPVLVHRLHHHGRRRRVQVHRVDRPMFLLLLRLRLGLMLVLGRRNARGHRTTAAAAATAGLRRRREEAGGRNGGRRIEDITGVVVLSRRKASLCRWICVPVYRVVVITGLWRLLAWREQKEEE